MSDNKIQLIRSFIATTFAILSLPLALLSMFTIMPIFGNKKIFWTITNKWIRTTFYFANIEIIITGWEQLPHNIKCGKEAVVFMSNHESNLDPPVLMSTIPIYTIYIAKKEIKWIIPIGWLATMAGIIFIDRKNKKLAIQNLYQISKKVKQGNSIVIFPEGTRTKTKSLLPFKKGGFLIAKKANVRIVPIAITGGFEILSANSTLIKGPGKYKVKFGNPIDPKNFINQELLIKAVKECIIDMKSQ